MDWITTPAGWRIRHPISQDTYDLLRREPWFTLAGTSPAGDVYWIQPDGWPALNGQPWRYETRRAAEDALAAHWRVAPNHGGVPSRIERFVGALLSAVVSVAAPILFKDFLEKGCTPTKLERAVDYACTPEGMHRVFQGMMVAGGGIGGVIVLASGARIPEREFRRMMGEVCTPPGRKILRRSLQALCGAGRAYAGSRTPTVNPKLATQVRVIEHTERCGCSHADHVERFEINVAQDPAGGGYGGEIREVKEYARVSEGGSRAPTVNAKRMWKIAAQLYQDADFAALAVRECLQNSVDSIRKAGRKSGEGRFEVIWDPRAQSGAGRGGTMTFRDNGKGMTLDIFTNKFMDLGSTGKEDDPEAGGGFGVAKAAILNASRSFDWTIRSGDWEAESDPVAGTYQVFRRTDGEFIQGVETILRDVDPAAIYSKTYKSTLYVDQRCRYALALSNVPGIKLLMNGDVVDPLFPGNRGSKLDYDTLDWGTGNDVTVKGFKRSDSNGGFYVRMKGLYQFTAYGVGAKSDIVVDITTRNAPEHGDYPLTPARDGFRRDARDAFAALQDIIRQEAREGGDVDREYDDYGGDEDEGFDAGSEMGSLLDDPDTLKEAESLMGGISDLLKAKVEGGTWKSGTEDPELTSTHAGTGPAVPTDNPFDEWRDLAAAMPRGEAVATPGGREAIVGALTTLAGKAGVYFSERVKSAIQGGDALSEDDVAAIQRVLGATPDEDTVRGGGGAETLARQLITGTVGAYIESVGVSAYEDRWDTEERKKEKARERARKAAEKLRRETLALNPFGKGVKVKISRKNFDKNQRRAFKRNARKYLPHLLLWEGITRLIAQSGRVVLPFKVGFLLDNTTRAMAVDNGESGYGRKRWILLNPTKLDDYLTAYPDQPAAIASYLYTLACHEIAHLPHMGERHGEGFVGEREDLQMSTGHIVPALETLVLRAFPKKFPAEKIRVGGIGAVLVLREREEAARALERVKARNAEAIKKRDAEIRELRRAGASGRGNLSGALVTAQRALDTISRLGAGTGLAAWAGGPRGRATLGDADSALVARLLREDPSRALALLPGLKIS